MVRKFWGYYDNGVYRVGCNGATLYVYDQSDRELCRFRDVKNGYTGIFRPKTNIFVVKSTDGFLAIYDLEKCALVKRMAIGGDASQDEGFAFAPDGKWFYNIEKTQALETRLTIYDASDYSASRVLFADAPQLHLQEIEFDEKSGICYIFGFVRDADRIFQHGFVGKVSDGSLSGRKKLPLERYRYIRAFKSWERSGYTEKALRWSVLQEYPERPAVSLRELYGQL